ncbi:MAG TPA: hypothetical protein VK001_09345 [Geminicoccaceae bacterium]|nr:hypothetical protein [Geminicoccaceae bacterium]
MEYKTLRELAGQADVHLDPAFTSRPMTKQERLERWAMLLARDPERQLSSVEEVEYGTPRQQEAKRADDSALSVAFADPVLREQGLQSDRVGDAARFFELSHWEMHQLVCSCHYGRTMSAGTAALRVRAMAKRTVPRTMPRAGLIAAGVSAAAVAVVVAIL